MRNFSKFLVVLATAGVIAFLFGLLVASIAFADTVKMTDTFTAYSDGQTVTDYTTYNFLPFPAVGAGSGPGNPSSLWEMDTGWLYGSLDSKGRHWGYSRTPLLWGAVVGDSGDGSSGRYFFRLNTQATSTDPVVQFDYKTSDFGTSGYTVAGADATEVWLRYQTEYWLYIVSFDKTNSCIVAKRKVPTNDNGQWGGPSNQIANKGVYFTLFTDSSSPTFGSGFQCISWAGLATSTMAHDGTATGGTIYNFKVTATTVHANTGTCTKSFDCVQLQVFRYGTLLVSWTDQNDGTSANGSVFQTDWNLGWWNHVTGYNASWGLPIVNYGKSGIRADNIQTWISNWTLSDASSTAASAGTSTTIGGAASFNDAPSTATSSVFSIQRGTFKLSGGTLRLQ